jgi:hypothetical protein
LRLEKERREVMHQSMEDEEGSGRRSLVKVMAAAKTDILMRAMVVGASIVDNRQWGSVREWWGALVRLESRVTEDWVKGEVCGGLLAEVEERAKQGEKSGGRLSALWRRRGVQDGGAWHERRAGPR